MNLFKLQPPENLLSRLYILEYLREIGAKALYEKSNDVQKKQFFYKFTSEDVAIEEVDLNWEYSLFEATMPQLEFLIENFIEEVEEIEKQRKEVFEKLKADNRKERMEAPASVSVYDLAKTSMENLKTKDLVDATGLKLN